MHNELSAEFANMVLSRLLEFFEAEIAQSSDAEVLEAAADLRMNPRMKGSAAFGGITYPWGLGRGKSFYGLSAEEFAALQRRFRAAQDDAEWPDLWPDGANVSDWLALIRQLREK
jgi:hypothetical protein